MSNDLDRLHSYYSDLRRESATKLAETRARPLPDDVACRREEARMEAIERQYGENVADLERRYAMSVEVEMVQAAQFAAPVCRAKLRILRRKGTRDYVLDWNPFSKQLDTLPCEGCGIVSRSHGVCDRSLHIACPECAGPCFSCGKPYCRACCPSACPSCGGKRGN